MIAHHFQKIRIRHCGNNILKYLLRKPANLASRSFPEFDDSN